MKFGIGLIGAALLGFSGMAQAALPIGFQVTIQDPGVQDATPTLFHYYGVETFDGLSSGLHATYNTDFGGGPISGVYTNLYVHDADQYGGAGGSGDYAVAGLGAQFNSYSLKFSNTEADNVNYFGYWLSALDAGNILEFYDDGNLLGTFTPTEVIALVGDNGSYYGNPNNPSQNTGEPYVFVNFFNIGAGFDEIVFKQAAGSRAGYESDNHTVGWYKDIGGNPVPGVPEPATWAMLIVGFGMIGFASRRRKPAMRLA